MPYLAIEDKIFDAKLCEKKRLETTETWIGILEGLLHGDGKGGTERERRGRQDSYYED